MTMIDIETEALLTPNEACRHPAFCGPNGRPAHLSKVYRAINPGCRGVRLETVRTPSGLKTSRESIGRFVARLTDPDGDVEEMVRTPAQRRREISKAANELAGAGI